MPAMKVTATGPLLSSSSRLTICSDSSGTWKGCMGSPSCGAPFADAALLQASQQQITTSDWPRVNGHRHRPDKRTKSTRLAERFSH
jgi:hypothetical protein